MNQAKETEESMLQLKTFVKNLNHKSFKKCV